MCVKSEIFRGNTMKLLLGLIFLGFITPVLANETVPDSIHCIDPVNNPDGHGLGPALHHHFSKKPDNFYTLDVYKMSHGHHRPVTQLEELICEGALLINKQEVTCTQSNGGNWLKISIFQTVIGTPEFPITIDQLRFQSSILDYTISLGYGYTNCDISRGF